MDDLLWLFVCEALMALAVIVGCRSCNHQREAAGSDADAGAQAGRSQSQSQAQAHADQAQPAAVELPHFPFPYVAGPFRPERRGANIAAGMPRAQAQPPAPAEGAQLPYFLYAPPDGGSGSSSSLVCAICLEQLRRGEPCSEVPACRHVFHRECVALWMKSNNTCPLCRATISPWISGSIGAPPVADMV